MAVMLDDGKPSRRLAAYHGAKAHGGAALTIIEAARVHPTGDSGRPAIRAYDPACVPGYKKLAGECQSHGCLRLRGASQAEAAAGPGQGMRARLAPRARGGDGAVAGHARAGWLPRHFEIR